MPTRNIKLKVFKEWAHGANFGDVFVYHREPNERDPEVFYYARKLSSAGIAFLFSRRLDNGNFEKCARRTPVLAHVVLDKVSAAITIAPSTAFLDEKADAA
jgi:hypothetical protein